ncbi:flagellar basal body-associated FliL family protein [soil metagenome]
MADDKTEETSPKKKGKLGKILVMTLGAAVLIGGGVGGTLFAMGKIGGGAVTIADAGPRLVPKSEEKRASAAAGGEGESKAEGDAAPSHPGMATPKGQGGDKFASNYFAMDKEFTSNLQDSVHFIQIGIAVSTPYDDRVIDNIKTHEIAVRSAVLMALGDTTEDQVFSGEGKKQLQARLVSAINDTLKQKEGFGGVSNVYFTNFVVQ